MGRKTFVQYDYRLPSGELFTTVAPTIEQARQRRDEWLRKSQTVNSEAQSKSLEEVNAQLTRALSALVEEGECYCADHVAARGPCAWCRANALLKSSLRDGVIKP